MKAKIAAVLVSVLVACVGVGEAVDAWSASTSPAVARAPQSATARAGVLAGVRLGPRSVAGLAEAAGFRGDDLFTAVAVSGGESWLYTRARNDNTAAVSAIPDGAQVRNVETGELVTVIDGSAGKIRLSDGSTSTVPLTVQYVVSRDVGLWQINIPAALIGSPTEAALYVPAANAAAAYALWVRRGWQPWAAYNSGAYLADTYRMWAALGVSNLWMAQSQAKAVLAGKTPLSRVPWISIPNLRGLYPSVPLG